MWSPEMNMMAQVHCNYKMNLNKRTTLGGGGRRLGSSQDSAGMMTLEAKTAGIPGMWNGKCRCIRQRGVCGPLRLCTFLEQSISYSSQSSVT